MLINRREDEMMYFPLTEIPHLELKQETRLKTLGRNQVEGNGSCEPLYSRAWPAVCFSTKQCYL